MRLPAKREVLLIAASIVFAAVVAEVAFRIMGLSYPIFHRLETLRGWAPWPGVEGEYLEEGRAYISINSEGFRDREHAPEKPSGVYRVAVLGDSFTEAQGIPIEKTFWSVLGDRLAQCPALSGRAVEVLNFGVTGYGSAQELVTLKVNTLKFSPDAVLLAFYTGNDVWNNARALDGHPDRIYARLESGRLVLDSSNTATSAFRTKVAFRNAGNAIVNASRLFQVLRRAYHNVRLTIKHGRLRQGELFNPRSPEQGVYMPPSDEKWRQAWAATEAIVREMNREVRARGANFWLVSLTNPPQIYPDPGIRRNFAAALGVNDLGYPDDRLARFAAKENIPAIALTPELRKMADTEKIYLHGFENSVPGRGHWNARGHRAAGDVIARKLCASIGG